MIGQTKEYLNPAFGLLAPSHFLRACMSAGRRAAGRVRLHLFLFFAHPCFFCRLSGAAAAATAATAAWYPKVDDVLGVASLMIVL